MFAVHNFYKLHYCDAIIALGGVIVYIVNLKLKKIRKAKGYSTRELEKRSDVSRMRIESLEREANVNIKTATLCKLAEALDVHPDDLITFTYFEGDSNATT